MPLPVRDYSWTETGDEILLKLPLKGVKTSKVDVTCTSCYLKVSYQPYLLEGVLKGKVKEDLSSCKIGDGLIAFRLIKENCETWKSLFAETSNDELNRQRQTAETIVKEKLISQEKEKLKKKDEMAKFAIQQQLKVDQANREVVDLEKQRERDSVTKDLEAWKDAVVHPSDHTPSHTPTHPGGPSQKSVSLWTEGEKELPQVRGTSSISVNFTHRIFPTAARESKEQEEQEWLSKMAEARKIKLSDKKDQLIDQNPESLKDKGNLFFKKGDFESALSAYSEGLVNNPNHPFLYSNRAACYLKLSKFELCIEDCHKALELLYPVVPSNYLQRTKVLVRRGTAYANLELYDLSLQDFESALKLDPTDEQLRNDRQRICKLLLWQQKNTATVL